EKPITGLSPPPLLVVIKITPLAALDPYNDAEAASFNTDMSLISSGLNAENSAAEAGIPSIIYIGDGLSKFVRPLTVMPASLSFATSPGLFNTVTPGEIPCKAFAKDVTGLSANCLGVIEATEPVRFAFF